MIRDNPITNIIMSICRRIYNTLKYHVHSGHSTSFLILLFFILLTFVQIPSNWNKSWYYSYIFLLLFVLILFFVRFEHENKTKIPKSLSDIKESIQSYSKQVKELLGQLNEYKNELNTMYKNKQKLENQISRLDDKIAEMKVNRKSGIFDDEDDTTLNNMIEEVGKLRETKDSIVSEIDKLNDIYETVQSNIESQHMEKSILQDKIRNNAKHNTDSFIKEFKSIMRSFGFLSIGSFVLFGSLYMYVYGGDRNKERIISGLILGCFSICMYLLYTIRQNANDSNETKENKFMFATLLTEPFVLLYNMTRLSYCNIKSTILKLANKEERILLLRKNLSWFNKNKLYLIIIAVCSFYISIEMIYPNIQKKIQFSNYIPLVTYPIDLNTQKVVGDSSTLYGINKRYTYSIQGWIYIDQNNPSNNVASNKDTILLNYGSVPKMTYNVKTRTLSVFIRQGSKEEKKVFETQKLALQKWNYFVFNYTNGLMDVFLNAKLVATENNIVPFLHQDEIKTGEDNGILGGIRDVYYNRTPMSIFDIYSTFVYGKLFK